MLSLIERAVPFRDGPLSGRPRRDSIISTFIFPLCVGLCKIRADRLLSGSLLCRQRARHSCSSPSYLLSR